MKTGGRTLSSILKQNVGNTYRFHYGQRPGERLDDLKAMPEPQRRSLHLIHGHLCFGLHRYLPQPCVYITLLRDPVERVVSHYYYALHHPKHYTHSLVTEKGMSLAEYVSSGITDLNNGQTRCIAGDRVQQLNAVERGDTSLLEVAKQNLDSHFLMAGVTERFDEFILLLKHYLNLEYVLYTHSNVNSKRPKRTEISPHDIELIRHHNQLDIQLYEYVQSQFQGHVEAAGDLFQRELVLLKEFNSQYCDVQSDLDTVKRKFSRSRIRLRRIRKTVKRLQSDVANRHQTIDAMMTSRRGQLWQKWMHLKQRFSK